MMIDSSSDETALVVRNCATLLVFYIVLIPDYGNKTRKLDINCSVEMVSKLGKYLGA